MTAFEFLKLFALILAIAYSFSGLVALVIRRTVHSEILLRVIAGIAIVGFAFFAFYLSPHYGKPPILLGVQWGLFGIAGYCWQRIKKGRSGADRVA
jgi:hypothetical protein